MKTSLTGIKPTGAAHLGNYLGAIRPALRLAESHRSIYFIADYHGLTTQRDPARLRSQVYDIAATWLACGLDPDRTLLFRQSDVIEVFELAWIFACIIPTGQLERGHAYKDAIEQSLAPNAGIFNYPLLMAADIILYDSDLVPIGKDQVQHLELARDIAVKMNHAYGEGCVKVPSALITEAPLVPGTDGRKMSKSYDNTVPLFAPPKELEKEVMKFKTDSTPLEAPKNPEGAIVYELYKAIASPDQVAALASKLTQGGYGWGHAKADLFRAIEGEIAPHRARYQALRADEAELDAILQAGASRARAIASETMARVRRAIGITGP
jgi:tryptophanyl-tRNA synthetase